MNDAFWKYRLQVLKYDFFPQDYVHLTLQNLNVRILIGFSVFNQRYVYYFVNFVKKYVFLHSLNLSMRFQQ